MIAIISNINSSTFLCGKHISKLRSECDSLEVEIHTNVFSEERLRKLLSENKLRNFIIFSNFPPNSTYPGGSKKMSYHTREGQTYSYFEADSYTRSRSLFEYICSKYKILEVHFLTGAPVQKVPDEYVKSVSKNSKITIIRKNVLYDSVQDTDQTYCNYIVEIIRGFVMKNPFT
jgi:hypothetical protein